MNRRRFIGSSGLLAAGLWLFPKDLLAQAPSPVIAILNGAKTAKIQVTKLRGGISMLEGSGGNVAVLNGPQGKLLVDAGIGLSKVNMAAALQSLGPQPIKYLINTHHHFDHTFGNEWLHRAGATIIAQETTLNHLQHTVQIKDWNYTFPPAPRAAWPTVVFKDEKVLHFNGEAIEMKRYKPAHTDCDISVYFPKADVLHAADTFWNGYYPMIDYSTGGSIGGMITAAQRNIEITTPKTIIIPGHGPVGNRAQLIEYHDMLVAVRDKVAALKKQGKSLQEVYAAAPTAKYDQKWASFLLTGKFFSYLAYEGV